MKKYSFIAEYRNGTYISQYYADSVEDALVLWVHGLPSPFFSDALRKKIELDMHDPYEFYTPVLIEGTDDIWCESYWYRRNEILVHIVECPKIDR